MFKKKVNAEANQKKAEFKRVRIYNTVSYNSPSFNFQTYNLMSQSQFITMMKPYILKSMY